ncbi:hypothetical protein GGR58DRAFT_518281 [Xylaria digitata]|nr:hypothetical protein GGR58DRAFT_518281 [Xylaria digitata]
MGVGDEASLRPTDTLLLQQGRKHYRTQISPIHWQLRSLISAERNGMVLFPAGINNTHITRLDTRTRECETIKVISFHPRCLVANGGWICCGGENGEFAIIREITASSSSSSADDADSLTASAAAVASTSEDALDHHLPHASPSRDPILSAEPSMTELRRDMLSIVEQISGSSKTWSASNYKFGTQRVNCITIWHPPKPPSDRPPPGSYTSPVAILANNDKTVTVVNLNDSELLDELRYPDCVNRGVISPDGSLLVAICDDPFLYIHARTPLQGKRLTGYEWSELPRVRLKDQSVRDVSDCRGSFAACFSPSGRYLAVGTQYGTISIFDVTAFADPERDPLVTYFSSTRAPSDCGAVRDMAFSPGPHDMLAWTEHRGRIGLADARTNFTKRQIISIEDHEAYDHFSLNERNTTIDPRLLDPRSERSAAASSPMPGLLVPGRAQSSTDDSDTSRLNHPFSPEETAILEAVQSDRRRREAREAREQREQRDSQTTRGSAVWRSSVFAERVSPQPRTPGVARERDRDISERLRYLTSLQRDTLTRIFEREQSRENRDHQRSAMTQTPPEQDRERRAPTPRRRSSIMQALAQNVDSSARLQRLGEGGSGIRDYSSAWGPLGRSTAGWADLETLYNISNGETSTPHDATRTETNRIRRAIPIIGDVWNDDISGFRRAYGRIRNREHEQHPDDTAGLSWSEDGRTLYIGAEDGIYEFHINILSRKVFPTVTLR